MFSDSFDLSNDYRTRGGKTRSHLSELNFLAVMYVGTSACSCCTPFFEFVETKSHLLFLENMGDVTGVLRQRDVNREYKSSKSGLVPGTLSLRSSSIADVRAVEG